MTVFRANAAFLAAAFAAVGMPLAGSFAAPADAPITGPNAGISAAAPSLDARIRFAQLASPGADGGPIKLAPRRAVQAPSSAAPAPESPGSLRSAPVFPSEGGGGPVQTEKLDDIDGDSIGTLGDGNGGLGAAMWQGMDRVFIERLVALMPERQRSPVMRDLARRLLLSSAAAPRRHSGGPSLLALRIGALFAAGDLENALSLIAAAPVGQIEESLVRTEIEARLFRFDTAGACGVIRGPGQEFSGLFWQQASAFCLMLSDRRSEAALISDLLAERSDAVHPSFFATMERLGGAAPPVVESLSSPTALNIAMMRAANLALPADVTEKASPAALQAIALSPNAPLSLRLGAAESAALLGTLPAAVLLQIYGAVPLEEGDFKNAAERADAEWGPKGRALIVRAALAESSATERAQILQKGFAIARLKGGSGTMYIAAQPAFSGMIPSADLAWFAADAARAFVAAGDLESAARWLAVGDDPKAAQDVRAALWPLSVLMPKKATAAALPMEGAASPVSETPLLPVVQPPAVASSPSMVAPEAVEAWWRALDRSGADVVGRARVLFSLLEALSLPVPSGLWALVLDTAPSGEARLPAAGIRNALRFAARMHNRGAAVALALVVVGADGPGADNLPAVEEAIAALRAVGLEAEAHRLALETAVATGL